MRSMVILSRKVTVCSSFWKKGTGLMFTKKTDDFAYVFPFSSPRKILITMWFVFYPIDILFLKKGVVVEVASHIMPFTHYQSKALADTFVELPAGKTHKKFLGKQVNWNTRLVEILDK